MRDSSMISISFIFPVVLSLVSQRSSDFPLAGDLLRAEQNREGSQDGELIRTYIRAGQIVPMHITMKLLEKKMNATLKDRTTGDGWEAGCGRFLIDGFPRKMDQAVGFDEQAGINDIFHLTRQLNSTTDLSIITRHLLFNNRRDYAEPLA